MPYILRFLGFVFSRHTLLFMAVVAISLGLWFVKPLAPDGVRLLLIGLVLSLYALYGLYRLLHALHKKKAPPVTPPADAEVSVEVDAAGAGLQAMTSKVEGAVAQLKRLQARSGLLRRIFQRKRYLYELPWYMVLGSSDAGKTTALLNSGLQFPAAHQTDSAARDAAFGEQSATLHCDWWFSNEAVLIDIAGRYVTQSGENGRIGQDGQDAIEWRGLLGLMRKYRTRAPLNGVIVALDAADLTEIDDAQRSLRAGLIRDRLAELRSELGIRFPVYVMVTKADRLSGFASYFHSLTTEGRTQTWGITLPFDGLKERRRWRPVDRAAHRDALREQIHAGLASLDERVAAGLRARLNEGFHPGDRRVLFALPQEFASLAAPLVKVLDDIFLDSRLDSTQRHNTLRGVYFTSAAQKGDSVIAGADSVLRNVSEGLLVQPAGPAEGGRHGFFLRDLLTKVIIPEARLVRPNLAWEWRARLIRSLGHSLAAVAALWLISALTLSFNNNSHYLGMLGQRVDLLAGQMRALVASFKPAAIPDVLHAAGALPNQPGLDLASPPRSYRYGLYAVPPVLEASTQTYVELQEHLLLPPILQRMEAVLAQSVKEQDAKTAYETLRVYKLLHDSAHYLKNGGAADVRNWVLKDWERSGSATVFGGRASMAGHVEALFSGARAVQSASLPNEALIREVQHFLDGNTSTHRVYERAKTAMLPDAPQEFTLVRAVGPQAGTVFAREGGLPLERGVPGLFTYDGYHELFNKRLPEFVDRALQDDAWVMGRGTSAQAAAADLLRTEALREDVRRQYLNEYAEHWSAFLESIRTVAGSDIAGSNLGFDLSVLRQFAAPDSPLSRLARAAARETTLSRPLAARAPEEKSLLDKATDVLNKQTTDIGKNLGIRNEDQLEKQIVDNRFAALREVVTGQPDANAGTVAGGAKPGLEAVSGLVNEFYTLLVVADTALTAGSLPPSAGEVGARLKLEAGKLPAPFREVLTALATSGSDKVVLASTDILRKQAQAQLDRIMGQMAMHVSEPCRRGIEGRYPFAPVAQDASIEDFTLLFAVGGAADEFFAKYLAPYVDTGVRPWRYKTPDSANATAGMEALPSGTPSAPAAAIAAAPTGPTVLGELLKLLPHSGPNLEAFYRAQQIRDLFFREAGGRKMSWKIDLKVLELEPTITDLIIDIDGQGERYIHGPVVPIPIQWPGPRGGSMAGLIANPRISGATSTVYVNGPWALFRLLDKGRLINTATPGRTSVEFSFDGRKALLDISAGSQPSPLNSDLLTGFRCPGRSA
jgi:type VI secretion system protein ImpL